MVLVLFWGVPVCLGYALIESANKNEQKAVGISKPTAFLFLNDVKKNETASSQNKE